MKSFGEKRLVKSVKLLSLSIKPINPIQKYPHIIESYARSLKMFAIMLLLLINFLFLSEFAQPQSYQSMSRFCYLHLIYPMSSNIRILIKINYISPIFYFIKQIISRINSDNSTIIFIIF